jgi:hypothetical protein
LRELKTFEDDCCFCSPREFSTIKSYEPSLLFMLLFRTQAAESLERMPASQAAGSCSGVPFLDFGFQIRQLFRVGHDSSVTQNFGAAQLSLAP